MESRPPGGESCPEALEGMCLLALRERSEPVSPVGGPLTAPTGAAKHIPWGTGRGNGDVTPVTS
jgi:hypothetical protein